MTVVYRDEIGCVMVEVNGSINFIDGVAYFTVGDDREMVIPIEHLAEIF